MRKILIDSHILIWWLSSPEKIRKIHLDLISDPDNVIFISIASLFELSLKIKNGKLNLNYDFKNLSKDFGIENLQISLSHLEVMRIIEFKHKDPFDMIIVAQAISENIELISYDKYLVGIEELKVI